MYRYLNILSFRSSTPLTFGEQCSPKWEFPSSLLAYSSSIPNECNSGWLPAVTRGNAQLSRQIYIESIADSIQEGFAFITCLRREALSKRLLLPIIKLFFNLQAYSVYFLYFMELTEFGGSYDENKWRISSISTILLLTRTVFSTRQDSTNQLSTTTTINSHKTIKTLCSLSRESIRVESIINDFFPQSIITRPQDPKIQLLTFSWIPSLVRVTDQSRPTGVVYE